jgi:plastocyanin
MRKLIIVLAVVSVVAGIGAAFVLASTRTVRVGDNFYSTRFLRIRHGSTIVWRWGNDFNRHNVTAIKGPTRFHSATKRTGTYRHVFRRRGLYTVICTIHPAVMRMRIRVI